jgi:hypothetical protein
MERVEGATQRESFSRSRTIEHGRHHGLETGPLPDLFRKRRRDSSTAGNKRGAWQKLAQPKRTQLARHCCEELVSRQSSPLLYEASRGCVIPHTTQPPAVARRLSEALPFAYSRACHFLPLGVCMWLRRPPNTCWPVGPLTGQYLSGRMTVVSVKLKSRVLLLHRASNNPTASPRQLNKNLHSRSPPTRNEEVRLLSYFSGFKWRRSHSQRHPQCSVPSQHTPVLGSTAKNGEKDGA